MTIVGLTGYATSGKDTAAQGLILDQCFERLAFADPMRDALRLLNPIIASQVAGTSFTLARDLGSQGSGDDIEHLRLAAAVDAVGWDEAKKHGEVRRLLQVFGTDVCRATFGDDCWVNAAKAKMESGVDYVFTDVRFPNEVEFIHRAGGIVVRIDRPGVDAVNTHVSDDISRLKVDHVLVNDDTTIRLQSDLCKLVALV